MLNKLYILLTMALAAMGVIAQGDATCRGKAVCGYCVVREEPVTGRNIVSTDFSLTGSVKSGLFIIVAGTDAN